MYLNYISCVSISSTCLSVLFYLIRCLPLIVWLDTCLPLFTQIYSYRPLTITKIVWYQICIGFDQAIGLPNLSRCLIDHKKDLKRLLRNSTCDSISNFSVQPVSFSLVLVGHSIKTLVVNEAKKDNTIDGLDAVHNQDVGKHWLWMSLSSCATRLILQG